jgi:hypothetical protein
MKAGPSDASFRRGIQTTRKLLCSKGCGSERIREKAERNYRHVRLEKSNESELYDEALKSLVMSKGNVYIRILRECTANLISECMASGVKAARAQDRLRLGNVRTCYLARNEVAGADMLVVVMKEL